MKSQQEAAKEYALLNRKNEYEEKNIQRNTNYATGTITYTVAKHVKNRLYNKTYDNLESARIFRAAIEKYAARDCKHKIEWYKNESLALYDVEQEKIFLTGSEKDIEQTLNETKSPRKPFLRVIERQNEEPITYFKLFEII